MDDVGCLISRWSLQATESADASTEAAEAYGPNVSRRGL